MKNSRNSPPALGTVGTQLVTIALIRFRGLFFSMVLLHAIYISRDMVTKANSTGGLGIALLDMTSFGGNGVNRPATGVSWNKAARFSTQPVVFITNIHHASPGNASALNLSRPTRVVVGKDKA